MTGNIGLGISGLECTIPPLEEVPKQSPKEQPELFRPKLKTEASCPGNLNESVLWREWSAL